MGAVLLASLLLAGPAAAEDDLALHGYVKASAGLGLVDPVSFSGASRFQGDLTGRRGPAAFRFAADLDLDASLADPNDPSDRAAEVRFLPVECRVDLHLPHLDLGLGKQYVFWGQTDWVNPTDLFTPWDYVHIDSELEDYRIAPWALRATGWLGDASLDVVWVPFPMPHAMGLESMASDSVQVGEAELPPRDLAHGDVGARISGVFWGFDAAAMAFHGMDARPGMTMTVDPFSSPPLILVPKYGMLDAVGGDLSHALGSSFLLKAEAANYWTEDRAGDDPTVRNPELAAVAGLTWVPHPNFNATVQGTVNHLWRYDPDADIAALKAMGDPSPEVDSLESWGVVERVAWTWRDLLSLSVIGVQGLPEGDHFEMGMVSWRAADGLTVVGGVLLFGGPEDSRFGRQHSMSQGFVEVKAAF